MANETGSGADKYRTAVPLARGGTSEVFASYDAQLGRKVALKYLLRDDPALIERLLREARAQARIEHPNVCRVYEVGERDGKPFIAMQLIEGETLGVAAPGMTLDERVRVMKDVAEGVHAAHRLGLIHRDLKPGNVMVERDPDGAWHPWVLDFGLVHDVDATALTATGAIMGTPSFMAPEQARGAAALDRRTDVYGLGATLYAVLLGRPPFEGSGTEVLFRLLSDDPPLPRQIDPAIPRDLESVLLKALEKDPARRYPSARELAEDLKRYLDGEPVTARPATWAYRAAKRLRRHRRLAAVGSVAALVGTTILVWGLVQRAGARERAELAGWLGQEVRDVEWQLRAGQMSPRHDTTAEREHLRARIEQIAARTRTLGPEAAPFGEYALGRGLLALGEAEAAAEHLDRAWEAGIRAPEAAFARGVALGRVYHAVASRARALRDPAARDAALADARRRFRDPAFAALAESRGSPSAPPAYVEGLVAFYEERWDEALRLAADAVAQTPWLWEAHLLAGQVHRNAAAQAVQGDALDAATRGLDRSDEAFRRLVAQAPSAPDGYWGLCSNAIYRLHLVTSGALPDSDYEPWDEEARASCRLLEEVLPSYPELATNLANLELMLSRRQRSHGEDPAAAIEGGLRRAREAVRLTGGRSAAAWRALGDLSVARGRDLVESGREADTVLAEAAEAFTRAGDIEPTPGAVGNAGNAWFFLADQKRNRGVDPTRELEQAETAYRAALELSPDNPLLWGNVALVRQRIAAWKAREGLDPRPDLDSAESLLVAHTPDDTPYAFLFQLRSLVAVDRARAARLWDGGGEAPHLDRARAAASRARQLAPDSYEPWWHLVRVEVEESRRQVATGQAPVAEAAARTVLLHHRSLRPNQGESWIEEARLEAAVSRAAGTSDRAAVAAVGRGLAALEAAVAREPVLACEALPVRVELLTEGLRRASSPEIESMRELAGLAERLLATWPNDPEAALTAAEAFAVAAASGAPEALRLANRARRLLGRVHAAVPGTADLVAAAGSRISAELPDPPPPELPALVGQ